MRKSSKNSENKQAQDFTSDSVEGCRASEVKVRESAKRAYTYIVRCADGTLYCGWTNDIEKRIAAHNAGKGAKYTKSRRPVTLVHLEEFETKQEAMSREAHIKQLTREEKLALIKK